MSQAVYEGHRTYRIRGVGVAAIVAVAASALTLVVLTALYWAVKISTERAGGLAAAQRLEDLSVTTVRALTAAQFVALALAIVWLWRARKNLDAFPDTDLYLTPGWAIGGWFLPISNLFVPGRMMANIARQSSTDRLLNAAAKSWWLALLVSMLAYRFGPPVAQSRLEGFYVVDATAVSTYYGALGLVDTVAAAAGLVAAAAFGFTVLRISAAQEERIHRGWYEEQVRVMGVTPAPSAPEPGGSATIGA